MHRHLPKPHDPFSDLVPPAGIKLTPKHYAYLKISEGCNHRCSFCIIPSMRGDLVSRPIGEVMREAENLAGQGVKELLVISQDTSAYGVDLRYKLDFVGGRAVRTRMHELVRELGQLGIWVRLHYVYPYPHVDDVIPLMAEGKVLPYLDVPVPARQSAHPEADEAAGVAARRTSSASAPGARCARTSPSARPSSSAFPARPRRSSRNCWTSCARRNSTASAASPTRRSRARRPTRCPACCRMRCGRRAARASWRSSRRSPQPRLARKVGTTQRVLVDEVGPTVAIGRTAADAPEIDGVVYVKTGRRKVNVGDFVDVKIARAEEHDLHGKPA